MDSERISTDLSVDLFKSSFSFGSNFKNYVLGQQIRKYGTGSLKVIVEFVYLSHIPIPA
jgi:hypothetical protein